MQKPDDARAAGAVEEVLSGAAAEAAVAATPRRPGAPLSGPEVAALAATIAGEADPTARAARIRGEILPSLAMMDPLIAGPVLRDIAKTLGIPVADLRNAMRAARPPDVTAPAGPSLFPAVEPWPEAVALGDALTEAAAYLRRFAVLPEHGAEVLALWAAVTWTYESFDRLPLLLLTSPAPRSGKSTVLELLSRVVARPLSVVSVSPAALYRVIAQARPTVLIDEADAILRDDPDLTAVINAAHARESARVVRCHPDTLEPEVFGCFAPIALAGNNPRMAPATRDRMITVRMARKGKDEQCDRARARAVAPVAMPIARKFARLAAELPAMIRDAPAPVMPECLHDRAADCWEPLFILAALAGGPWPERVRHAAVALSAGGDEDTETLGVRLLADLRRLFEVEAVDRLSSERIVDRLVADKEAPWGDEPRLTVRRLARLLKPFGILSRNIRTSSGSGVAKGYFVTDLTPVFIRYLSNSLPPPGSDPLHPLHAGNHWEIAPNGNATRTPSVADGEQEKTESNQRCSGVADENPRGGWTEKDLADRGEAEATPAVRAGRFRL